MKNRLYQHIFQTGFEIASRVPGIELPVFGAQQLAAPHAVKAGGAHRIDPLFQRDAPATGPDIAAALLDVSPLAERVARVAKIDAENRVLVHPCDFFGMRPAVPQMIKIKDQADIVAGRLFQQLELLEETARDNIGLVLDFYHLWDSGTHPEEIARVNKNAIFCVDFCDSSDAFGEGGDIQQRGRDVW